MDPPVSSPTVVGQVCDRCRLKKVKCDGAVPSCSSCISAQVSCTVSTKLRRRTKIRGFQTSAEDHIKRLQTENDELRRSLQAERETCAALQRRLEEQSNTSAGTPNFLRNEPLQSSAAVRHLPVSTDSQGPANHPTLIFQHMGRLVLDSAGQERFAGSTSGVHFVLSVQRIVKSRQIRTDPFPESCFRLHLLEPYGNSPDLLYSLESDADILRSFTENFRHHFPNPTSFYIEQISLFVAVWGSFCPVLAPSDLARSVTDIFNTNCGEAHGDSNDFLLVLFQVCLVIIANSSSNNTALDDSCALAYLSFVRVMLPRLIGKGDIASLQALVLFSFYLQTTGQVLLMTQLNGILVRLAQSLGLHRHSRRFKFVEGHIEMRKRVWWWIYLYDKMVSIMNGLPKLISDVDVDVDYPLDCELNDVNTAELIFPLPGEVTQVSEFISYVHLGRILSETLSELYTTTRRRRGPEKIAKLHTDLQAWEQRFGKGLENSEPSSYQDSHSVMRLWTSLMAQITMMLIHRPALTFDEHTPEFVKSLDICTTASSTIISLLNSHNGRTTLKGVTPIGPSLIFQCGLMQILYLLQRNGHDGNSCQVLPSSNIELTGLAVDMLAQYTPDIAACPYRQKGSHEPLRTAINEVRDLLRSLCFDIDHMTTPNLGATSPGTLGNTSLPGPVTPSQTMPPDSQASSFDFLGQFGMLDSLNHLDWILDGSSVDATPAFEENL